jgi:hypothetical protein
MRTSPCPRNLKLRFLRTTAFMLAWSLTAVGTWAQSSYYRHTFFDNGPKEASYYYSAGKAVAPSTLETRDKKLPLDRTTFFTGPNSVKVAWE